MRTAELARKTRETDIALKLNLDGGGFADVDTGCGFMNHMLELFAFHGGFDLEIRCQGDTQVDDHHTVEDVGIVLGQALFEALGDRAGIARYGSMLLPMDEALVLCALDLSGRDTLGWHVNIPTQKVGTFDTELVKEFMLGFVRSLRVTLHFQQLAGENSHHIIEAMFKGLGRSLRQAAAIDPASAGRAPSSKGMLV